VASLTIRNLEDDTKNELRLRAARRGASMEDEARSILRAVVRANVSLEDIAAKRPAPVPENAWESIRRLRKKHGTFDLDVPERPDFVRDLPLLD
jgi:antitoxin FitA